jgi:16S rRNA (cytosine967-C5)-methyltransferase
VAAFLTRAPEFQVRPVDDPTFARFRTPEGYLRLSPRSAATDGFFVAVLARRDDRNAKPS